MTREGLVGAAGRGQGVPSGTAGELLWWEWSGQVSIGVCYERCRGSQILEDEGTLGKAITKLLLQTWLSGGREKLEKEMG